MYSNRPNNLLIGFHGCDESIKNKLISEPNDIRRSQEKFDWLGHGFYVWENNQKRAMQWAKDKQKRGSIDKPAVVGVIFQLEHCFDLTDASYIELLPTFYESMIQDLAIANKAIPKNKNHEKDKHQDLLIRELDCAVFEYMHQRIKEQIESNVNSAGNSELRPFDTIRGVFTEGGPVYTGAAIQCKTHIQVCIRNLNCIKGFFHPRELTKFN